MRKIQGWLLLCLPAFLLLTSCRSEEEYELLRQSNETLQVWVTALFCALIVVFVLALVIGNMMGVKTRTDSRKGGGGDDRAKIYRL